MWVIWKMHVYSRVNKNLGSLSKNRAFQVRKVEMFMFL